MSGSSSIPLERKLKINREQIEVSFFREVLSESVAIEMMRIPRGQFEMGSPETELNRRDNEGPQHL